MTSIQTEWKGQKKHEYFMGRELKTSLGVLVTLSNLSALTPHDQIKSTFPYFYCQTSADESSSNMKITFFVECQTTGNKFLVKGFGTKLIAQLNLFIFGFIFVNIQRKKYILALMSQNSFCLYHCRIDDSKC